MESTIVTHTKESRDYELTMRHLPADPEEYFNETIVEGFANWAWTGTGTAERNDETGREKEFAQVCD